MAETPPPSKKKKRSFPDDDDCIVEIIESGNDSADERSVEICPPPEKSDERPTKMTSNNRSHDDEDDDDDEPVILSSTVVNPNISYPHQRHLCGKFPYTTAEAAATQFCENCFCTICDQPVSNCSAWAERHCYASLNSVKAQTSAKPITSMEEVTFLGDELHSEGLNEFLRLRHATTNTDGRRAQSQRSNDILSDSRFSSRQYGGHERGKRRWDKRITEILAENLAAIVKLTDQSSNKEDLQQILEDDDEKRLAAYVADNKGSTKHAETSAEILPVASEIKMEGDISELRLHNSFFVEGIRIGWPFSTILTPQRQMAVHIIKALKRKLHVVLESPTGTGKSAAILCSVLAWQRYHAKLQTSKKSRFDNKADDQTLLDETRNIGERGEWDVPTIIYCSRTHSQVAQMVASLQKTPYRPRMTVLGSRNRLCINEAVVGGKGAGGLINNRCRERKVETDKRRKHAYKNSGTYYDDDNPEPFRSSEGDNLDGMDLGDSEEDEGLKGDSRKQKPTCTHYQQLTTLRTARLTGERFIKSSHQIKSCGAGGEQTKLGVMDIEDLVEFGKDPFRHRKVALYRDPPNTGVFGIEFGYDDEQWVQVKGLIPGGAASKSDLRIGDRIHALNEVVTIGWSIEKVQEFIESISKDPMILTMSRKRSPRTGNPNHNDYSRHSVCPYYLSRGLIPSANLIFAPYNYVLDPAIRKSLRLSLVGSVVVLDEAHNIEDTLCESGSGEYGEIALSHLVAVLTGFSSFGGNDNVMLTNGGSEKLCLVAHELLLFLENILEYMQTERKKFERGPSVSKLRAEHSKYPLSDEHKVEISYSGPSGFGIANKAVGCAPRLLELGIDADQCKRMCDLATSFENHVSKTENNFTSETILTNLLELVSRFELAARHPEHFFIAFYMKPNGTIDHAFDLIDDAVQSETRTRPSWIKRPQKLPLIKPRTEKNPNCFLDVCKHETCRNNSPTGYIIGERTQIRHGSMCNGSSPRWECHLHLRMLSPGLLMNNLSTQCRSIILASGSLAPLPSLCAELNLYPPGTDSGSRIRHSSMGQEQDEEAKVVTDIPSALKTNPLTASGTESPLIGRLQMKPKPLEANHVVDLNRQLFACSIGHFPDGRPMTINYSNYKEPPFFSALGDALASVVEAIPSGGVLVFVPSYSFLSKCIKCWKPSEQRRSKSTCSIIWNRLQKSKGNIIVEPTGNQEMFEAACLEYRNHIVQENKCLLLAVFRGKMSEGISFNDNNARAVICIGIPFPNSFDRSIKAKKAYNDEQRKICKNTNLLPGQEWYSQQAFRAIAQALGRCIRHGADYGAIILMDSRLCDDGSPNDGTPAQHKNLPKWMRDSVRTLSMHQNTGTGTKPVLGGYNGLQRDLKAFFHQAPLHSQSVLEKWKWDLNIARKRGRAQCTETFDRTTGHWQT